MKELIFLLLILSITFQSKAQSANCTFKKLITTINFGSGNIDEVNSAVPSDYVRIRSFCPSDGYYTYASYTSDCHRGDWHTVAEDHTAGDASGNMLLVNSSYNTGTFFTTTITGLKGGTNYEFGVWLMNLCRISDKCPFPLLPNLTITLQTNAGKVVAKFATGEVVRHHVTHWTQHRGLFTMPASETSLTLVMVNNQPGGCGNDFAMDDITINECIKQPPAVVKTPPKTTVVTKPKPSTVNRQPSAVAKEKPAVVPKEKKPVVKTAPPPAAVKNEPSVKIVKAQKDSQTYSIPVVKPKPREFPPPPVILRTRENTVVKKVETESGDIRINLYDNGEIDGDTISIYHNNKLIMSHARLSAKPISIVIKVDSTQPHHEVVMVAENLGSIPPNTSLMVITTATNRYEVFISSTEQRNAKVIVDLKE